MKLSLINRYIFPALVLLVWAPATLAEPADALIRDLKTVLHDRLDLMPAVARYKWENKLPVEDLQREAQILDRTVERAAALGVGQLYAEQVVRAQMQAAKMIQTRLIKEWAAGTSDPGTVPEMDLVTEIRPRISQLTGLLLSKLLLTQHVEFGCNNVEQLREPPVNFAFTYSEWQVSAISLVPDARACNR